MKGFFRQISHSLNYSHYCKVFYPQNYVNIHDIDYVNERVSIYSNRVSILRKTLNNPASPIGGQDEAGNLELGRNFPSMRDL